ncbi:MAG: hypothetical protein ABSF83_10515 [Nitrososphaerales archaeon]|jgi:hypothetical protein
MDSPASEDLVRKSSSAHFRVWTDVFGSLEQEAERRRVSLNVLVNQVLASYVRDELLFEKIGYLKMTKDAYRAHLGVIPDDKLGELGTKLAKTNPREIMLARKGVVSMDGVLDLLSLQSRFGLWSLQTVERDGKNAVTLMHDLGPKESVLLAAYVTGLFALVNVRGKVTTTDFSVMIEY